MWCVCVWQEELLFLAFGPFCFVEGVSADSVWLFDSSVYYFILFFRRAEYYHYHYYFHPRPYCPFWLSRSQTSTVGRPPSPSERTHHPSPPLLSRVAMNSFFRQVARTRGLRLVPFPSFLDVFPSHPFAHSSGTYYLSQRADERDRVFSCPRAQ